MKRYLAIAVIITASIVTALLSTFFSFRNASRAADDFLKAQALGIASSLDSALSKYGTEDNIFRDIIGTGRWEGIAFLALYRNDGLTLLHSNENLVNRRSDDGDIPKTVERGEPVYGYRTLGTGEEVFVMNSPLHMKGSILVLRVALHSYPARTIVRQARLQLLSVVVVVFILSVVALFYLTAAKRKQELEKALAEKEKLSVIGEMASVLAHEIRNPLGSIKGFAQYLREQAAGNGPGEKQTEQYLDVIVTESERIERLTGDLLTYARQEDVRTETFDLPVLIREVLASPAIPQRITVSVEMPPSLVLTSDRDKVRQILANLLQNASDSIPGSGSVRLVAQERKDELGLTVTDSGTGMDDDTVARIFKPFYTTKTRGTGLGLAIVDRYVKALGGKITVDSKPGKGSSFTVTIPMRNP